MRPKWASWTVNNSSWQTTNYNYTTHRHCVGCQTTTVTGQVRQVDRYARLNFCDYCLPSSLYKVRNMATTRSWTVNNPSWQTTNYNTTHRHGTTSVSEDTVSGARLQLHTTQTDTVGCQTTTQRMIIVLLTLTTLGDKSTDLHAVGYFSRLTDLWQVKASVRQVDRDPRFDNSVCNCQCHQFTLHSRALVAANCSMEGDVALQSTVQRRHVIYLWREPFLCEADSKSRELCVAENHLCRLSELGALRYIEQLTIQ